MNIPAIGTIGGAGAGSALAAWLFKDFIREWWDDIKAERKSKRESLSSDKFALRLLDVLQEDVIQSRNIALDNKTILERIAKSLEGMLEAYRQSNDKLTVMHDQLLRVEGAVARNGRSS